MAAIGDLPKRRSLPRFKRRHNTAADYLKKQRLKLMEKFVPEHQLYLRASQVDGGLFPSLPSNTARVPVTESELGRIKKQPKLDLDDASRQLQKSQLVQMWNANYEEEEQWKDYDEAKSATKEKKHYSGLASELFDNDRLIGEKRRRIVTPGYQSPAPRKKLVIESSDSESDEEDELEEGEIAEYFEDSIDEYQQKTKATCETLQTLLVENLDEK